MVNDGSEVSSYSSKLSLKIMGLLDLVNFHVTLKSIYQIWSKLLEFWLRLK